MSAGRDPAAPLLTYYDGPDRVELSGSTTANWVAKTANLLDALGAPERVGVLLPLHWQAVVVLLAALETGAEAVVGEVAGCDVAFVAADRLDAPGVADVDEVLALSCTPLGAPCGALPLLVQDYAREVPGHADRYGGTSRRTAAPAPLPGVTAADRVLTALGPEQPGGTAVLLGTLAAGGSLVLAVGGADLAAVAAAERVTRVAGADVTGVAAVPGPGPA